AGKTGSAQAGNGSVNAWFCGYAPLDNPRYVAAILVKNGAGGSQTAAPLFKLIMEQMLQNEFALEAAGKMEKKMEK
ncbi:MAG: penicillin-binding transpeptidase domain-containing protein, partial [Bacillota bacterium]